jgi:hypothetical protein
MAQALIDRAPLALAAHGTPPAKKDADKHESTRAELLLCRFA